MCKPALRSSVNPLASKDFRDYANTYFFADSLASFDPATGQGTIHWLRHQPFPAHAFDNTQFGFRRVPNNDFRVKNWRVSGRSVAA